MASALVPQVPAGVAVYSPAAKKYVARSKADNTKRTYGTAWAGFEDWAEKQGHTSLPAAPATVVEYLVALAEHGAKVSTIGVHRAAIAFYHRAAGELDPTSAEEVRAALEGIARALGSRPAKKAPLTLDELREVLDKLPGGLAGTRDRALLLLGWAGGFRRSELVALDVEDLRVGEDLKALLRRSKTDQAGEGFTKSIPRLKDPGLCPVRALERWLDAGQIHSGPVFRPVDRWGHMRPGRLTPQSVARIVKAAARSAGLQPRQLAGHSLRSGFITAAASAGAESRDIMAVTGHRSDATMRGYVQDAGLGAKRAIRAAFGE